MAKKTIKLNESELRDMISEAVVNVLNEVIGGRSSKQLAYLSGAADGATKSLGGKIKGMFNPEWKKRKEMQSLRFGSQATGNHYSGYKPSDYAETTASMENGDKQGYGIETNRDYSENGGDKFNIHGYRRDEKDSVESAKPFYDKTREEDRYSGTDNDNFNKMNLGRHAMGMNSQFKFGQNAGKQGHIDGERLRKLGR